MKKVAVQQIETKKIVEVGTDFKKKAVTVSD